MITRISSALILVLSCATATDSRDPASHCPDVSAKSVPEGPLQDGVSGVLSLVGERGASANAWGHPGIPIFAALVVVENNVITYYSPEEVTHAGRTGRATGSTLAPNRASEIIRTEFPASWLQFFGEQIPILIVPQPNTRVDLLYAMLTEDKFANPVFNVEVLWRYREGGSLPVTARAWVSRSLEKTSGDSVGIEFLLMSPGEDRVVLVGPDVAHECSPGSDGLTNCVRIQGRSNLSRVGLCGFTSWGEAIRSASTRVVRINEIVLLRDCPGKSGMRNLPVDP
jgi:hypothetical protein